MATIAVSGEGVEETHSIEAASVTIGRGLECDVRLRDLRSSRRHCKIEKTDDGYKVVDLESGNGTFLNGTKVAGEHALASGDRVVVGKTTLTFTDEPAAAPEKKPRVRKPLQKTDPIPKSEPVRITAGTPTQVSRRMTGRMNAGARRGPAPEPPPARKIKPALLIGIGAGVVVLAIAVFLMVGDGGVKAKRDQFNALRSQALKAERAEDLETALELYRKAVTLIKGDKAFDKERPDLEGKIEELKKP